MAWARWEGGVLAAAVAGAIGCTDGGPTPRPSESTPGDSGDGADTADSADTGDPADSADTGDTAEDALGLGEPCSPEDDRCGAGLGCCTPCCATYASPECMEDADDGSCPLPDLVLDAGALAATLAVSDEPFAEDHCAVVEGCIDEAGERRLMRFTTAVENTGQVALAIENTLEDDRFHYSECHEHMHMDDFATYELLDGAGALVVAGHKQAFCLMDTDDRGGGGAARYTCDFQGISAGWADTYGAWLDCQWIDISTVPAGEYTLRLEVNPLRLLEERDYGNNVIDLPVTIVDRGDLPPVTDPCPTTAYGAYRDCGWEPAGTFSCTPGAAILAGCDFDCRGDCTGDPVLRLCDGEDPACIGYDALAAADNGVCGGYCPSVESTCPASGSVAALVGATPAADEAGCAVEVVER